MEPHSEKRTVSLLAANQALFQTSAVMMITISGLVGLQLAPNRGLATLPVAMGTVAAAATMIPAALFMQRYGRRTGFMVGTALGAMAGVTAVVAVTIESFYVFLLASMFAGSYQAFSQYYRFAAADSASAAFKSRAISWVVAGGVVAAFAGPSLVRVSEGIGAVDFRASFGVIATLGVLATLMAMRLRLPPMRVEGVDGPARPLSVIMRQPVFLTALASSAVGFAVMSMVMTATPIAMHGHGHSLGTSATVIQWHVLGMFVPSFFTGSLIARFGVLRIMGIGTALLGGNVVFALSGVEFLHYLSALTLLGVGWNFLFIGGTTLLTDAYWPSERAKTQGAHDFLMFGAVSVASFSSGTLLNAWGWNAVNLTVLPMLAVVTVALIGLRVTRRRELVAVGT